MADWTQPVEVGLHDIINFHAYTKWAQETVGFGQLAVGVALIKNDAGARMRLSGDTEAMGREWTRKALHALVDTICNAMPEYGLQGSIDVPIPPAVLAHWAELERVIGGEDPGAADQ